MAKCTWIKKDGTRCRNKATRGDRCYRNDHQGEQVYTPYHRRARRTHTGSPARRNYSISRRNPAQQRTPATPVPACHRTSPTKSATVASMQTRLSPPSRKERERVQVEKVAQLCADVITVGWQATAAEQVIRYAPTTWAHLSRSNKKRSCKALARTARLILKTKELTHKGTGKIFGWTVRIFWGSDIVQAFTEELISKIPLPIDAKMIAVARSLQVAGILLCVSDDNELRQCDCFIDLALTETKEVTKKILVAGMSDWVTLARFRPRDAQTVRQD